MQRHDTCLKLHFFQLTFMCTMFYHLHCMAYYLEINKHCNTSITVSTLSSDSFPLLVCPLFATKDLANEVSEQRKQKVFYNVVQHCAPYFRWI